MALAWEVETDAAAEADRGKEAAKEAFSVFSHQLQSVLAVLSMYSQFGVRARKASQNAEPTFGGCKESQQESSP